MELPYADIPWIWTAEPPAAGYALFHRRWQPARPAPWLRLRLTACAYYELWVDGRFAGRGPVHGDPAWTCWDELTVHRADPLAAVELAVVVHLPGAEAGISTLIPAPGGLALACSADGEELVTDAQWAALPLAQWRPAPKRGWALGWAEDYDARLEPAGWAAKRFDSAAWPRAQVVQGPWSGHAPRPVPAIMLGAADPHRWQVGTVPVALPPLAEASAHADREPLAQQPAADLAAVNRALAAGANAITADLGAEHIGHYEVELEAPAGTVIDLAGAELLQADGRPWIHRKGTSYTVRVTAAGGRLRFRSFLWSGFRWLHLAVRAGGPLRLHALRCATRSARLPAAAEPACATPALAAVAALCRRTLVLCAQEHLIDCPTREQAQYWGDGVFIAQAIAAGTGDASYLRFYLDGFIAAALTPEGQLPSVYPGRHVTLLDYSLIPLLAQRFHRAGQGCWHRPAETLAKARALKRWYDARRGADGLLPQLHDLQAKPPLITFIDHPGLGWHDFPHRGIDRAGRSAGLNLFLLLYLRTMVAIAADTGAGDAAALAAEAGALAAAIRRTFVADGLVHDAEQDGVRSEGTAWQVNALAVLAGVLHGDEAVAAMRAMLAGYDRLCRCSPYFHFYFLPALARTGLAAEAEALITREWGPMLAAGATTTWEGFQGDAKDTLCHPWSAAPYLFLLEQAAGRPLAWPD